MNAELDALLVVQANDERLREIRSELGKLAPRLESLEQARRRLQDEVERNEKLAAREQEKHRTLESSVSDHRARHEKNVAILNQAHKLKEATAAAAQVETARRVLAEEESELLAVSRRLNDLRSAVRAGREALEALDESQKHEREQLNAERAEIEQRLTAAVATRNESARDVPVPLLSKYERVYQRRQTRVVVPLRNFTCSACDTAIPLQRRPILQSGQQHIEVCEACGVLLYLEQRVE